MRLEEKPPWKATIFMKHQGEEKKKKSEEKRRKENGINLLLKEVKLFHKREEKKL